MARVRVFNPVYTPRSYFAARSAENPRKRKALTREQVERRQAKAVRFVSDVVGDEDLADELESLTPEEYAQRKGVDLINNPTRKRKDTPMKKDELKQAVKDGVVEALKESRRSNPNGQQVAPAGQQASPANGNQEQKKILSAVDDAAAAIADGDEDEALDILNGVLDRYDNEEEE
jgi:enoyl-CoA hydratase/carnithine racemase